MNCKPTAAVSLSEVAAWPVQVVVEVGQEAQDLWEREKKGGVANEGGKGEVETGRLAPAPSPVLLQLLVASYDDTHTNTIRETPFAPWRWRRYGGTVWW